MMKLIFFQHSRRDADCQTTRIIHKIMIVFFFFALIYGSYNTLRARIQAIKTRVIKELMNELQIVLQTDVQRM